MPDSTPNNALEAESIAAPTVGVGTQIINNYLANGGQQTDQETLARQVAGYLRWVEAAFGTIKVAGIKRDAESPDFTLDQAYVSLLATPALSPDELEDGVRGKHGRGHGHKRDSDNEANEANEADEADERHKIVPVSLDEIHSLGKRLVITGGPGCGKTTVLLHIAWVLAKAIREGSPLAQHRLGLDAPLPLPIFVPLAAYAKWRTERPAAPKTETRLADFLTQYLIGRQAEFGLPGDFFIKLLQDGNQVMLLLDGLDEIADEALRLKVTQAIEDLVISREQVLRAIVTCRTAAYKGRTALQRGFRELTVSALDDARVSQLVQQMYGCIYPHDRSLAEGRAQNLIEGIARLEADRQRLDPNGERLVTTPLMVRLLLIVHYSQRRMPEQRAELFAKATTALIENDYAPDQDLNDVTHLGIAGDPDTYWSIVQHLAFHMHRKGQEQGREIDSEDLRKILQTDGAFDAKTSKEFITLTHSRSGLVEERLGNYRFIHLGFQEFLAARHIRVVMETEGLVRFFEGTFPQHEGPPLFNDPWWREVILLCMGDSFSEIKNPIKTKLLLQRLAGLGANAATRDRLSAEQRLAALELAGTSAYEWPKTGEEMRQELARQIVGFFGDSPAMLQSPPTVRARAGSTLAALGDPRFDPDMACLPYDDTGMAGFINIPGGKYTIGTRRKDFEPLMTLLGLEKDDWGTWEDEINDKPAQVAPFYMARYPVTVGQWKVYVDSQRDKPNFEFDNDSLNGADNEPAHDVNWADALGYCHWLNERLKQADAPPTLRDLLRTGDWQITLPSEIQWEYAARGAADGRPWPWGDRPDPRRANYRDTGIGGRSAVGCFPDPSVSYGCLDMIGNVDEWTRSLNKAYPYVADDGREDIRANGNRSLRGGAFFNNLRNARVADRYAFVDNRYYVIGFRVSVSPAYSS